MNFALFCEFWCFSLGKTSTIHIVFLFRNAPAKSSWIDLSLVWFAGATPESCLRTKTLISATSRYKCTQNFPKSSRKLGLHEDRQIFHGFSRNFVSNEFMFCNTMTITFWIKETMANLYFLGKMENYKPTENVAFRQRKWMFLQMVFPKL